MTRARYLSASERELFRLVSSSRERGYAGGHFSAIELVLLASVLLVAAIGLL